MVVILDIFAVLPMRFQQDSTNCQLQGMTKKRKEKMMSYNEKFNLWLEASNLWCSNIYTYELGENLASKAVIDKLMHFELDAGL